MSDDGDLDSRIRCELIPHIHHNFFTLRKQAPITVPTARLLDSICAEVISGRAIIASLNNSQDPMMANMQKNLLLCNKENESLLTRIQELQNSLVAANISLKASRTTSQEEMQSLRRLAEMHSYSLRNELIDAKSALEEMTTRLEQYEQATTRKKGRRLASDQEAAFASPSDKPHKRPLQDCVNPDADEAKGEKKIFIHGPTWGTSPDDVYHQFSEEDKAITDFHYERLSALNALYLQDAIRASDKDYQLMINVIPGGSWVLQSLDAIRDIRKRYNKRVTETFSVASRDGGDSISVIRGLIWVVKACVLRNTVDSGSVPGLTHKLAPQVSFDATKIGSTISQILMVLKFPSLFPDSPHADEHIIPLGFFSGRESADNYRKFMATLSKDIKALQTRGLEVWGREYRVEFTVGADLSAIWKMFKMSVNSDENCPWCFHRQAEYRDIHGAIPIQVVLLSIMGHELREVIPVNRWIFCALHASVRIVEKMLKMLVVQAKIKGEVQELREAIIKLGIPYFNIVQVVKKAKAGQDEFGSRETKLEVCAITGEDAFKILSAAASPDSFLARFDDRATTKTMWSEFLVVSTVMQKE
eukprot:TRINITY_DN5155_c0_g5_i1.p1 TRINITY_DN5155_c0_g5~~TRINITY_DN5155_c0_g5_i1.p1  ORF type:complete len:588 (+),score=112.41 TRINITY_DN5155_c0_g5_i1:205-1968(+)